MSPFLESSGFSHEKVQNSLAVIIVSHNSAAYLDKNLTSLKSQTLPPAQIIIVDSGSKDSCYLKPFEKFAEVFYGESSWGFCKSNNYGLTLLNENIAYVLFLNPDAFLAKDFLESALNFMESDVDCAATTGPVYRYDFNKEQSTDTYDTTGVFSTFYGKWYDRSQGRKISASSYQEIEEIPAICGAVMFCRLIALRS